MTSKPADTDAYLEALPEDARATLQEIRRLILAVAPAAVESFAYGMPAFKYQGRPLVYMGAARNHCALYGIVLDAFADELAGYDVSKGTIRFQPTQPLPEAVVRLLLSARMADIDAAVSARKSKKPRAKVSE
jgi:uncharacterized protein YdhG (YjbR/CyaY superfamily)